MKRILLLILCVASPLLALSGLSQIKMEELYDSYRTRFIEWRTIEEQSTKIQAIQKALQIYINHPRVTPAGKLMFDYLRHLFCEAESVINGRICQDNYTPSGPLTQDIGRLTLDQIRWYLIAEHSVRRQQRGLGKLIESNTLNTIAQEYAEKLCEAWYISHELNGSQLEQRYEDGGYNYRLGGENLWSWQRTISQILDQLTTSLHHRENMYEPRFQELGVGQCDDIWVLNYGTVAQ